MKPTDIWTNSVNWVPKTVNWVPKKMCRNGDLCHEEARRGAKTGIQASKGGLRASTGWKKEDRVARAIIPENLCEEIADVCEGNQKEKQIVLNVKC